MLSLKKICLEIIVRASKKGNTVVLGPQLFLPEIYPYYVRQMEIDADDGSERCYITTEKNFHELCTIYLCISKYFNTEDNEWPYKLYDTYDGYKHHYENRRRRNNIPLIYEYNSEYVLPITYNLYEEYYMDKVIESNYTIHINDQYKYCYNALPDNINIFVRNLPPLLVNLGILFRKLIGPKYIWKRDRRQAECISLDGLKRII